MNSPAYHPEIGAIVRGLLNGFKHTPESVSPLIGIDVTTLEAVIGGSAPFTPDVEEALLRIPAMNRRDFYAAEDRHRFPVKNDTDAGVRLCPSESRQATERTLTRGPHIPYYTYADTAMSATSTFRPEWIKELFVHDGTNADLPDWAFNKGHFEHQVTYFIGTVNFYWIDREGRRHVRQMHTGDTNYIVPFVPHTFTTREPGQGLILAVTYGGALADPDIRAAIQSQPVNTFVRDTLARCRELAIDTSAYEHGVLFRTRIPNETYSPFQELLSLPHQPTTYVHELRLDNTTPDFDGINPVDRWIYNLGNTPVKLGWSNKSGMIDPGGSAFIQPNISHRLSRPSTDKAATLLVVDTKPNAGNAHTELALSYRFAGEQGVRRSHTETTRWY